MPLKEFECLACHKRFEVILWINEPNPGACPSCGAKDLKQILGTFRVMGTHKKSASPDAAADMAGLEGLGAGGEFDGGDEAFGGNGGEDLEGADPGFSGDDPGMAEGGEAGGDLKE